MCYIMAVFIAMIQVRFAFHKHSYDTCMAVFRSLYKGRVSVLVVHVHICAGADEHPHNALVALGGSEDECSVTFVVLHVKLRLGIDK